MVDRTGLADSAAGIFSGESSSTADRAEYKRLILMRHGDPDNNGELKEQVRHAREQLFLAYPDMKIDALLYSPVKRTVRTAGEFYALHVSAQDRGHGQVLPFRRQDWLEDDSGGKIGYEGLLDHVRGLNNGWNTVLLVTHSTTGPLIARALNTDADDMQIVSSMFDYASVMVLDLPVSDWKRAGEAPAILAKSIGQPPAANGSHAAAPAEAAPDDQFTI